MGKGKPEIEKLTEAKELKEKYKHLKRNLQKSKRSFLCSIKNS